MTSAKKNASEYPRRWFLAEVSWILSFSDGGSKIYLQLYLEPLKQKSCE